MKRRGFTLVHFVVYLGFLSLFIPLIISFALRTSTRIVSLRSQIQTLGYLCTVDLLLFKDVLAADQITTDGLTLTLGHRHKEKFFTTTWYRSANKLIRCIKCDEKKRVSCCMSELEQLRFTVDKKRCCVVVNDVTFSYQQGGGVYD